MEIQNPPVWIVNERAHTGVVSIKSKARTTRMAFGQRGASCSEPNTETGMLGRGLLTATPITEQWSAKDEAARR